MAAESNIGWKVYDRRIRRSRTRPNKTLPFHEYYDHRPATRSPTRFLLPPPFHCHAAVTYYPIDNSISLFIFGRNRASAGTWDIHVFVGNLGKMYIYIGEFWFVSHFFTTRITHGRFTFLYKKCYWNSINQMALKKKRKNGVKWFFFHGLHLSFFLLFFSFSYYDIVAFHINFKWCLIYNI